MDHLFSLYFLWITKDLEMIIKLCYFFPEEKIMHIDENKKFDRRNIEKNIKDGMFNAKDYEIYLSRLPDVSDKAFLGEELEEGDSVEITSDKEDVRPKKAESKKKIKGKGK